MKLEEIKKLTELARIEMTEEEMLSMAGDFDSILAYVGQIQKVSEISHRSPPASAMLKALRAGDLWESKDNLENVVREDVVTNQPNSYSGKIIKEMPETQDGFLKVKQIL